MRRPVRGRRKPGWRRPSGLARAIDLDVVHGEVVRLSRLRPSTLLGSGAVERLKALIEAEEIGLAVVDWALTPVQQRNLEKEWSCKVIDRTRADPGDFRRPRPHR